MRTDFLNGAISTFKTSLKTKRKRIYDVEITSSTWACVCCNLLFDLKLKETEILSDQMWMRRAERGYVIETARQIWTEGLTAQEINEDIRQISWFGVYY